MTTIQGGRVRERGFSMIEVLFVIIIIGILAAIAIPMYLNQRDKAKNASAVEGGRIIMLGVLTYVADQDDNVPDPWPADASEAVLVPEAVAASDWPNDPFAGHGVHMRPVDSGSDTTPGRYLYREAPGHATNQRHQIVVYRKGADPFVIP